MRVRLHEDVGQPLEVRSVVGLVVPLLCAAGDIGGAGPACYRVGGKLTRTSLTHHWTCGSASGGSMSALESLLLAQQGERPQRVM